MYCNSYCLFKTVSLLHPVSSTRERCTSAHCRMTSVLVFPDAYQIWFVCAMEQCFSWVHYLPFVLFAKVKVCEEVCVRQVQVFCDVTLCHGASSSQWFEGSLMPPSSGFEVHVVTACTRTWCNMPGNESLAILVWELRILQVFFEFNYFIWNLLFVLIGYLEFVHSILNYRFIGNIWVCLHLLSVPHFEAMCIGDAPNSVPYCAKRTYLTRGGW